MWYLTLKMPDLEARQSARRQQVAAVGFFDVGATLEEVMDPWALHPELAGVWAAATAELGRLSFTDPEGWEEKYRRSLFDGYVKVKPDARAVLYPSSVCPALMMFPTSRSESLVFSSSQPDTEEFGYPPSGKHSVSRSLTSTVREIRFEANALGGSPVVHVSTGSRVDKSGWPRGRNSLKIEMWGRVLAGQMEMRTLTAYVREGDYSLGDAGVRHHESTARWTGEDWGDWYRVGAHPDDYNPVTQDNQLVLLGQKFPLPRQPVEGMGFVAQHFGEPLDRIVAGLFPQLAEIQNIK